MKSLGFWVALIVTGCFVALCSFAWGRVVTHWAPDRGYTVSERAAHHRPLAGSSVRPLTEASAREVVLWKASPNAVLVQQQAEVYAKVYGITDANIDSYRKWGF